MRVYGKEFLKTFLTGATKVAIMCLGNELLGDDAAGLIVCNILLRKISSKKLLVFLAQSSPEAYLFKIIENDQISHVIIVDAVDAGLRPGEIAIVRPEDFSEETVSTHRISLSLITNLLKSHGKKILILGIQPKYVVLGEKRSEEVLKAVKKLASDLVECLSDL
ncbi:MAG: hydrogenase maturation protease [Candidatus Njordarchaeales archaeon]